MFIKIHEILETGNQKYWHTEKHVRYIFFRLSTNATFLLCDGTTTNVNTHSRAT